MIHMPQYVKNFLYWLPRLSGLLAVFFMLFLPLGFYNSNLGLLANIKETAIYLLPACLFMAIILLAWKWPGIGSLLLFAVGLFLMVYFHYKTGDWQFFIGLPLIFLSLMFALSYLMNFSFSMSRFIKFNRKI